MPLLESPRYLVGKGRDEEAVRVVQALARINGRSSNLTVEQLLVVERKYKKSSKECSSGTKGFEVYLGFSVPSQGFV